jgi:hypothetical protein
VVERLNNKAKVTMRRSYGFRTFRILEHALYHSLGKLPEPELTPEILLTSLNKSTYIVVLGNRRTLQPTPIISIVAEEIVVIIVYDPSTCSLQVSDISKIKIKTLKDDHDLWSLLTCHVNEGLDITQSVDPQNSASGP